MDVGNHLRLSLHPDLHRHDLFKYLKRVNREHVMAPATPFLPEEENMMFRLRSLTLLSNVSAMNRIGLPLRHLHLRSTNLASWTMQM
jgi:hypothetical protein